MKTTKCKLLLLVSILAIAPLANGQVATWTNRYVGPGNNGDLATAIAVDTNGNVFVTGLSMGTSSGSDYATIKYSGAGLPIWTNRYNGTGSGYDGAVAAVADKSGNVIVTGASMGLNGYNDYDYATVKYSGAGTPLWTSRYSGPVGGDDDQAVAIAADTNGDVFVTGYSLNQTNTSYYSYETIKYSGTSGGTLWARRYSRGITSIDQAKAIAVDGSGNVFVTGVSMQSGISPYCHVTIKYSGAGNPLWTNIYTLGSSANDSSPMAMAVDSKGNIVVTGYEENSFGHLDYRTIKYSGTNGVQLWSKIYNGSGFWPTSDGEDRAFAVAVGTNDNVFVTGRSVASGTVYDYATVAYLGTTGAGLWTNRYYGGNNQARAIAVDSNNNVFVTGGAAGTGPTNDCVTIAYSGTTGAGLRTNSYNGPANSEDYGFAIAVDLSGHVFVTGASIGTNGYRNYVTLRYDALAPVVTLPPSITSQPAARTNDANTTATFSVTATGTDPLTYRWRKGTSFLANSGRISGATNTTLTISNVIVGDAANYTVVITNRYGAITSSVAALTVIAPPTIITQPDSATNEVGTTAYFSVSASGTSPLSYRWWRAGSPLTDGGNVSGATSSTMFLDNVTTNDAGSYSVIVTNLYGSITSSVAALEVVCSPPSIVSQPSSRTNDVGTTASFSVVADGNLPLAYQWWKDSAALTDGGNVFGAAASTLTLSSISTNDAGTYFVVITNSAGFATSSNALLTVLPRQGNQDYTYTTNDGSITITAYIGAGGDVTIPSEINGLPVTSVGDDSFLNCATLTNVTIPDSVTNLGNGAFSACQNLTNATLGTNIASIGANAFSVCISLASVMIPASVTSIGHQPFYFCASLVEIPVDPFNPAFSSVGGVLCDKSQTTIIQYPAGRIGSYTVPATITNIGRWAFTMSFYITNITIPDTVTSIEHSAFENCINLATIRLPNHLTTIGPNVFESCSSLSSVSIPHSVTSIEPAALENCSSLTNLTIPNSINFIGHHAFQGCGNLVGVFCEGDAPIGGADSTVFMNATNTIVYYLTGTTGWGTTFGGRPTVLWNPMVQHIGSSFGGQNNEMGFNITGTGNIPIVIEAATNLNLASWTPLLSCNLTNGILYFTDPDWTNHPTRFYRLRSP